MSESRPVSPPPSGAPPAPPRSDAPQGRPGKYQRSMAGLVGSIIAALGLIVAIWGLTWFQHRDPPNPAPTVEYQEQLALARAEAPFGVLAPDPPPAGWRATSVSWDGTAPEYAWHLGFLTGPGSGVDVSYVGLEQSNADPREFVALATPADEPGPPVTIDGQAWQTLTSVDETALVHPGDGVTTIVTGTAPLDELVAFAKSLSVS